MANYKCDTCGNVYKYKRNLKRHVNEKHGDIERWNCVEVSCKSTFLRRTSLSKHLVLTHGYSSLRAREFACRASRGDIHADSDLEDISADDSVFDLYDDIERLRAQDKSIVDFELDYLDDIRLGYDAEEANNVSASETVIEEKVENEPEICKVLDDVKMRDNSVQTDDEINDHHDGLENVHVSNVPSDAEQKITNNDMEENEKSEMVNKENDDEMSADYAIISGCESDDGFSCGDSFNSDGVATNGEYSINSDDMAINSHGSVIGDATTGGNGLVNVDDVSNGSVNGDSDEDNFIDISSDEDDGAVVLLELHTLTQTFVYTITRQVQYLNGQAVNVITTAEGEYFEN